ncbi:testis-expressed protein 51 isoform X1 [Podarcis raffonei]|uniref:testis-expressed protein 51 isoform X1 n=2 Tax=Podarcis raffonei TaxID=65483 RepID=UPI002329267E|nr:testis-expressed protein 51 isoform X1 [Podarcis raffonei]
MARISLLGWLAWSLPVQLAGTCLRCWPDAIVYFGYDSYLLLGQDSEATKNLGKLFIGSAEDLAAYGRHYLEREHMEREAGTLFLHLEQIIKRSGKDHGSLMREAEEEKKNFVKRLEEASKAFVKEVCSLSCAKSRFRPYEVAQCSNCQLIKVSCLDPFVCAGPNVIAAVLVPLLLLLGIGAAWWYRRRKQKEQGKDKSSGDEDSSESSEWSSDSSEKADANPIYAEVPSTPIYANVPAHADVPAYANVPNPPEFTIPSPPPFD